MASEEHTFESADAGSSLVYPMQAGALRKGGHCILKGHPCKISEISISKTGKHGHAKAHIVGNDIFTNKKCEDLCPTSHNMEVPNIVKSEYTLLDLDEDAGSVSVLLENGETKDDLNMPKDGNNLDETGEMMIKLFADGKGVIISVINSMGQEKIISARESTN